MSPQLEFETDALPDALVARPVGDVDMAATPEMETVLRAAVEERAAGCLVVDLGAADYIDSSGIELLFRLHAALQAEAELVEGGGERGLGHGGESSGGPPS